MIKKYLNAFQLWSGVVGIAILWSCIALGMHRAHLGLVDARPLSYLGVNPASQLLFTVSLLVSAGLFVNFGSYVKQKFQVTNRFMMYLVIGQLGQAMAAISPYGANSRYKLIHTVAAFILAFSLPLLIREFAISQSGNPRHRLYVQLFKIEKYTFLVGIGLFVFTKGIAPLGEALPALGFHVWIIALTYRLMKKADTSFGAK